ncbi:hypothetical protein [Bradyrhizobium sp. URHC0002]
MNGIGIIVAWVLAVGLTQINGRFEPVIAVEARADWRVPSIAFPKVSQAENV